MMVVVTTASPDHRQPGHCDGKQSYRVQLLYTSLFCIGTFLVVACHQTRD